MKIIVGDDKVWKVKWYKTIMGTILASSSHLSLITEVFNDLRLLLFWPAASSGTRPFSATHGLPVLPVTTEPSGFLFSRRGVIPGWSVFQALLHLPRDLTSVSVNPEPKLFVFWSPVTQSLKERFRFSLTYWTSRTPGPLSSGFGSSDAQTRRSDWSGSCLI